MIITIIVCVAFIFVNICTFVASYSSEVWEEFLGSLAISTMVGGFVLGIMVGVLGYHAGADSEKRASIEEALRLGSKHAVHDAYEYNETLKSYDNYFLRFTLRPESDYIDIEYYEN